MLRIYTGLSPSEWSGHLWRIEHAHNTTPTHWSNKSPLEIMTGNNPRQIPLDYEESDAPAVEHYIDILLLEQRKAHDTLKLARHRQQETAQKRRNPLKNFRIGNYILYQRRQRTPGKVRKLQTIWVGPYKIVQVDPATGNCKLEFHRATKIHPWFATDKLKPYHGYGIGDQVRDEQHDEEMHQDDQEYEVETILDFDKNTNRYLIKWKDYEDEENTWEPANNLGHAREKVKEFKKLERKFGKKRRLWKTAHMIWADAQKAEGAERIINGIQDDYFYPTDDSSYEIEDNEVEMILQNAQE